MDATVIQSTSPLAPLQMDRFFELSSDLLCITNGSGVFHRVNHAWQDTLGYRPEQLQGTCCLGWVHPEDRALTQAALADLAAGQRVQGFQNRYRAQDDTYHCLEWQAVGHQGWVYATARDVTAQQRTQEELQAALAAEQAANQLKSQFVSIAAHEFRTPLGIISSSAGIVGDYGDRLTPDQQQQHINRIQSAVVYMNQLMDDVMLFSRSEGRNLRLRPTEINLAPYCQELVDDLNLIQPRDRIQLTVHQTPPPLLVDKGLLRQILTNLLTNGLKYSPTDQAVHFTLDYQDDQAQFTVQDFGIGIPTEEVQYLFQAFHRASNVGSIMGHGLGLAIVKQLVDLHNGTITCQSQVNQGTTFTVSLPRTCALPEEGEEQLAINN